VVEQLSADEILHAKLGWSYLAELAPVLSDDEREGLARYLPLALGTIEQKMLAAMPIGPRLPDALREELAALGAVDGRDGREILYAVIEDVIVPRFEELGLPGRRAWADKRVA
jgi:hypothetical protein